jgi:agmatine/peptidylarginine deiminase
MVNIINGIKVKFLWNDSQVHVTMATNLIEKNSERMKKDGIKAIEVETTDYWLRNMTEDKLYPLGGNFLYRITLKK